MRLSTFFWLMLLAVVTVISLPLLALIFIVSLLFGVNYHIVGPGKVDEVNAFFAKSSTWVNKNFKDE